MKFMNPKNGYVEEITGAGLWTFIFGPLYFLSSGLGTAAFIWLLVTSIPAILLLAAMGGPAILIIVPCGLIINALMAFAAGDLIFDSYLRKGWEPYEEGNVKKNKFRKCPFCAEEIRIEAIKCKHCGSDLPNQEPDAEEDENPKPEPEPSTYTSAF